MSQLVYFKFFNNRLKKFVPPLTPPLIEKARYKLEIWNNNLPFKNLNNLYKLSKKEKKYDLYIKINNKYVMADKKNIKQINTNNSAKKTKSKRCKLKNSKSKKNNKNK